MNVCGMVSLAILLYKRLQSTRNLKYSECANRKHFYIIYFRLILCVLFLCNSFARLWCILRASEKYVRIYQTLVGVACMRIYAFLNMGDSLSNLTTAAVAAGMFGGVLSVYRLMMIYFFAAFSAAAAVVVVVGIFASI